jgi:SAM-dependent methyltransferase
MAGLPGLPVNRGNHPTANNSADRATFENFYDGKAPWDIGKPQGTFAAVADPVIGPLLDAGCGTGEHALFFAARGHRVTGIDFVEEALRRARAKAAERGLAVESLVKDATALGDWDERFAGAIDCGLFHCFSDADRRRCVRGLAQVVAPGVVVGRSGKPAFAVARFGLIDRSSQGCRCARRSDRREYLRSVFAARCLMYACRPQLVNG